MKVLFVVQGEGRGHLTQALTLEKMLTDNGHSVVGILVGKVARVSFLNFSSTVPKRPFRVFSAQIFFHQKQIST